MHGAYEYSDIHLSDEPASLGGELAIFPVFPKAGLENRSHPGDRSSSGYHLRK